jgi:hypothetical protein
MSDIANALTILPASSSPDDALSLVRPGSHLANALEHQGVVVNAPGSQRAIAKAVQGLARDIMEGAMLLASDAGNERAQGAVACLNRVRTERARSK